MPVSQPNPAQIAPGEEAGTYGQDTPYIGADLEPRYYGQSINAAFADGVDDARNQ